MRHGRLITLPAYVPLEPRHPQGLSPQLDRGNAAGGVPFAARGATGGPGFPFASMGCQLRVGSGQGRPLGLGGLNLSAAVRLGELSFAVRGATSAQGLPVAAGAAGEASRWGSEVWRGSRVNLSAAT